MQVCEGEGHLGDVEPHPVLLHRAQSIEVEAQVAAEHEVEDHEQVLVVLEREAQVADERRVDLFEETPLLDDLNERLSQDPCTERG